METIDVLKRFSDCHYELEKVNPGEITNCKKCPLSPDIEVTLEQDGLPLSSVTLKLSPCLLIAEMSGKIKG